ncbi:hypothetical protein NJC38_04410 [Pseudomonas sp. 21LCFQ010]|uniref:hypothetical protein n=1 Tax=Pseudomonas sp. 21LCFQ010 TaxID=2957506 RepID=UPI0020974D49|nr:hypothetical protein [Pseudomonas sp. 21LCFQ010]MCO8161395.1 hypothetical protein [Pseudomonas sp. 21LCFQ010]
MKKTLFLILTLFAFFSHADEIPISKSASPGVVNIRLTGTGLSQFSIRHLDLPRGYLGNPMKIKNIQWQSAHYSTEGITETVKICYYPYGYGVKKPEHCKTISPNASGDTEEFQSMRFGYESRVTIRHELEGGRLTAYPTGTDKITIHYQK